jgi:hypothetical protein
MLYHWSVDKKCQFMNLLQFWRLNISQIEAGHAESPVLDVGDRPVKDLGQTSRLDFPK